MKAAYLHAVGLATPGLPDWTTAGPVLRGETPYAPQALPPHRSALLPRNEARRAGASVRLALQAAEQVCDSVDVTRYATVFASANGDLGISDKICTALASPGRGVSPTQFHNSVHNAAAGYWSIATRSQMPANSVAGGLDSFAVGLREAWAMLALERLPVLLVAFETDGGGKLAAARPPVQASCALALAFSTEAAGALARVAAPEHSNRTPTPMADAGIETLRRHNPAARGLPLLAALARGSFSGADAEIVLESGQGNLAVALEPPR